MTLLLFPLIPAIGVVVAAAILARHVGVWAPFAFVMAYVFGVGALTLVNIGVFHLVDPKFREHWVSAWLKMYWPLWTTFFAPSAISALLACWFSRPSTQIDAIRLLGLCLFLILLTVQIELIIDASLYFVFGAFALLSTIFLVVSSRKRAAAGAHHDPSVLRNSSR
jgi:hypothetical protein